MTKEQKEAKQRTLLQLQAMGAKIPFGATDTNVEQLTAEPAETTTTTAAAKPKYERIRKKQTGAEQANQTAEEKAAAEAKELEEKGKSGEEVKESWDASSAEEDNVKEAWDAESDDEKSKATKKTAVKATAAAHHHTDSASLKKSGEQSEGDDSDENEEESEDESENESEEESDHENKDLPPMERVKLRLQVMYYLY
jgi:translation initiation factor 5B